MGCFGSMEWDGVGIRRAEGLHSKWISIGWSFSSGFFLVARMRNGKKVQRYGILLASVMGGRGEEVGAYDF